MNVKEAEIFNQNGTKMSKLQPKDVNNVKNATNHKVAEVKTYFSTFFFKCD